MLLTVMTTTSTPTTAIANTTSRAAAPSVNPGELYDWSDDTLTIVPARPRVLMAWLLLVATGLVVTVGGFAATRGLVSRWPRRRHAAAAARRTALTLEIRAALRRACTFYVKRTWCLQKSAVLACMMRSHGIPADLVIGVRKMPFQAHAWVESDGEVVNGAPTFKTTFMVMERW
jgi:hypothetical protein